MAQNISAEIISIGTEILLGEITDTNSVHVARTLRDIGVNVYYMTSVGDNENRITHAIEQALARADVVLTTGGLGPTVDDMTRQGVANATNRPLVFHQSLLDAIAERFAGFRSNMTDNNRRQAFLPEDATLIENPVGTAPCFMVEFEGKIIISLPGVPREMKFLLAERVVPLLKERYQLGIIKAINLQTAGIGESALDDMLGDELLQANNPSLGLAAHSGIIDIRITAKADDEITADTMIAQFADRVRERVGSYIFGSDGATIEGALVERLGAINARLAISETGIGDAISRRVLSAPNSAPILTFTEYYTSPAELTNGNAPDLQSLASEIAQKIAVDNQALVGISVISKTDQERDHADSEVGTAVAVYVNGETSSRVYGFGSNAEEAGKWTSTWALSRAWRMLSDA